MDTQAYVKQYANPGIVPFPCSRCTYPTTGRCQECNAPLCFLCQNGGKDGLMVCLECHVIHIREQALQEAWNDLQSTLSYVEVEAAKFAQEV